MCLIDYTGLLKKVVVPIPLTRISLTGCMMCKPDEAGIL
jgi:hypothetical protein